ncbi:MAG: hypothetical protein LBB22_02640 [Treponema sp.]|jgi:hypothetical protein|nr:hypothetical protein [Treponema sp.]
MNTIKNDVKKRYIIDIIAIILCIGGAALAFFLFWRDLNATLTKQNETPIATISFKQKTAQRRFGDRVVWDLLRQDSPLYSSDVIHTSDLAEATIFFSEDEASIAMSENTLVQIFESDDSMRIELSGGAVNVNAGSNGAKLILVASGTEIDIGAESIVSASAAAGADSGVQVVKGGANIITSDGIVEIGAGDALALNSSGNPVISPSISLMSPKPAAHYITDKEETSINFSWNTSNFSSQNFVRFQIGLDQRFSQRLESLDIRNSRSQTVNLKPGVYWWRALPVSDNDQNNTPEMVFSNKFWVVKVKKPETLSPAFNSLITYRSALPTVRFQWSVDETLDMNSYSLKAANNPQMQNPVLSATVRGDSFSYNELGEGTWYWQVSPVYPADWDGASLFSAVSNMAMFTIKRSEGEFAALSLIQPADAVFVGIGENAETVLFSWKNVVEAANYTFEIADNLDFQNPLLVKTLTENSYLLNPVITRLNPGVNFWRVSYSDSNGASSPPSPARYFNTSENGIVFESVFPPDSYSVNSANFGSVHFQWNSNLGTPYRFQIARDNSFSELLVDLTTEETAYQSELAQLKLNEGNYFWRIKSVFNGRDIETAARRIDILPSNHITLEEPPAGAEIDGLRAARGLVEIRWSSVEPVASSRLVVSRNGEPFFELRNPGRAVALPALTEGSYTWNVLAETSGGVDISAVSPSGFRVIQVPRLPAATGLRPASGQNFGAEQLRGTRMINFAWNPVPGANAYIFRLYRESDARRERPVINTAPFRAAAYAITDLTLLEPGVMFWQVEAIFVSPSGAIEQRGAPAESRFNINISVPVSPKFPDSEAYGR